jgi:hypothetical protein
MSASIELGSGSEPLVYQPGGTLRGRVALLPLPGDAERRVELAVLWQTEGKGNTDIGVVFYRVLCDGDAVAGTGEHTFETLLPILPVTYYGHLVKVGWLVRVRRLAMLGDDTVIDQPFQVVW